ncbi:hypothetical protein CAL7102_04543 [Dulcicalothrix desertica PCC 7102]|nr:hypothetical protein CAL7102_04543 [Dulcicalothrix desertica PCC 7102]
MIMPKQFHLMKQLEETAGLIFAKYIEDRLQNAYNG